MAENVRFNLWAVVTFLFMIAAGMMGILYAEGRETKAVQTSVLQRVSKIETQFDNITYGINELKAGQKELFNMFVAHEKRNGIRVKGKE